MVLDCDAFRLELDYKSIHLIPQSQNSNWRDCCLVSNANARLSPTPRSTVRVIESTLHNTSCERELRNNAKSAAVPSEEQMGSDSSSDPALQCHSQMCFSSGCGAPCGQHIAAAQACCWLGPFMQSTQRSSAVVYQPRHHPTNEMHISR